MAFLSEPFELGQHLKDQEYDGGEFEKDTNEYTGITNTEYSVKGTKRTIFVRGEYSLTGDVAEVSAETGYCYLGYRINGGNWVEVGKTQYSDYSTKTASGVSLYEGDVVEFGAKVDSNCEGKIRNTYLKMTLAKRLE